MNDTIRFRVTTDKARVIALTPIKRHEFNRFRYLQCACGPVEGGRKFNDAMRVMETAGKFYDLHLVGLGRL